MTAEKKTGRVELPFAEAARGQMRFPQELADDELGNNCPLCCPTCFAALRASRVDSEDPARGVRLSHRRGAGGCDGAEQRHVRPAYVHAAQTCEGKFFWTPETREGDWEPHGIAADEDGKAQEEGTARLFKVDRVLTGSQAARYCGGEEAVDAVFLLSRCDNGKRSRDVAAIFSDHVDSGVAAALARSRPASEVDLSVAAIAPLEIGDLDASFALAQLQDEILGCGGAQGRRAWLYDAEAKRPEEPAPEPEPPVEPEPECAGACPSCGTPTDSGNSGKDRALKLAAFVFCAIGCAFMGLALLAALGTSALSIVTTVNPLISSPFFGLAAFTLEGLFTFRCWKVYKGAAANTWIWAVLTLLLCNMISGVLLCIAEKDG